MEAAATASKISKYRSLNLYKLSGTQTRSPRIVYNALTQGYKLPQERVGGISYLDFLHCWIFFADPNDISNISITIEETHGVEITRLTRQELDTFWPKLLIHSYKISKNLKDNVASRNAGNSLRKAIETRDQRELTRILGLISTTKDEPFDFRILK